MPDFQHDHLPLIGGQGRQAAHRCPFLRGFLRRPLKPAVGFQLAGQPPPQPPPVIQGPVPEGPEAIVLRLFRRLGLLHQRHKRFLKHILRLPVAQSQRPAVQHQARGFRLVQPFAPCVFRFVHVIQSPNRHPVRQICIKIMQKLGSRKPRHPRSRGARGVPPAVFGVPPNTNAASDAERAQTSSNASGFGWRDQNVRVPREKQIGAGFMSTSSINVHFVHREPSQPIRPNRIPTKSAAPQFRR